METSISKFSYPSSHSSFWIIIFALIFMFLNVCFDHIRAKSKIERFIDNAQLVKDEGNVKFYVVSRETYAKKYELESGKRQSFYMDEKRIGSRGDILTTTNSPFNDVPVVDHIVGFYFGGHAGVVYDDDLCIESSGRMGTDEVSFLPNEWYDGRSEVIGLRLKQATATDYENFVLKTEDLIGKPYNYSYVFNTRNSYYCTDLIASVLWNYDRKFRLNEGFMTTAYDLINSKDTYLSYYHYIDSDKVKHVYYLGDL